MIEIVSATRMPESEFWNKSALGISLQRLTHENRFVARVAFSNKRGLPEIYNARIQAAGDGDALIFIHDDVWIEDSYLGDRVLDGLERYDVIGVAGNKRSVKDQPAWAIPDMSMALDDLENLSGAVGHGKTPFGSISFFGAVPAECVFLDGVFLAAKKSVLRDKGVQFDPRFDFHFYDMDFCRTARKNGLRIGTWPICLTHQSDGAFGSPQWKQNYRAYMDKWKD